MNERIKELLKQANELVRQDLEYSPAALLPQELVDEKFAELIVKECSSIVQNYMSRWPEDHELTKQIKKHFGVEL